MLLSDMKIKFPGKTEEEASLIINHVGVILLDIYHNQLRSTYVVANVRPAREINSLRNTETSCSCRFNILQNFFEGK